jgi:curved DNA-binding protein CbpA
MNSSIATTVVTTDPYGTLGLTPAAMPEEIKKAYFSLVRLHPPERDAEAFKKIRAAYEQLNTPEKRLEAIMMRIEVWSGWEDESVSPPALHLETNDVILAARALSDLGRTDWREDCREIKL